MKFRCDCETHILKIEDISVNGYKLRNIAKGLSLQIYDIYSSTGIKLKRPKLIADVTIINNCYPKEYDKLVRFIKKHSKK